MKTKTTKFFTRLVPIMLIIFMLAGCSKSGGESSNSLEAIKAAGVVTIGTEGTYPPYSYHDEANTLVGYDVEIAEAIAEKLGVKPQFVETKWDSLIMGVDSSMYNLVINQVGITDERKEKYDFSTPYTYPRAALIVLEDNDSITSFDDLNGKKSAQTVTSNWAKMVDEYGGEVVGTDGFNQSIDLVLSGRADATVNDDVTFYDYRKLNPNAPVKIAALGNEPIASGVLLGKNQPELLEAVNNALKELADEGRLTEISEKYFGADISIIP
ncbi:MAG: amino acid ABC transporter substrate-binding protein [Lachnospiraceae bacterium]